MEYTATLRDQSTEYPKPQEKDEVCNTPNIFPSSDFHTSWCCPSKSERSQLKGLSSREGSEKSYSMEDPQDVETSGESQPIFVHFFGWLICNSTSWQL